MQRNKIKADGTVYAAKEWSSSYTPVRIVGTEQMWTMCHQGVKPDGVRVARSYETMSASSSRPRDSRWSSQWYVTGFLAIRAADHNAEALETLRTFDMTHVRDMLTDEFNKLRDWNAALPEGLTVDVVVAREVTGTWEEHTAAQADKRAQYDAELKQRAANRERERGVRERAQAVMAEHGITSKYGDRPGRVTLSLDAEDFMALIERLSGKDNA